MKNLSQTQIQILAEKSFNLLTNQQKSDLVNEIYENAWIIEFEDSKKGLKMELLGLCDKISDDLDKIGFGENSENFEFDNSIWRK